MTNQVRFLMNFSDIIVLANEVFGVRRKEDQNS